MALSSETLVLREIYDTAGDLDIAVTFKGLNQLKKNYNLIEKENGWFIVKDRVECVCDVKIENLKYKPEKSKIGYFVKEKLYVILLEEKSNLLFLLNCLKLLLIFNYLRIKT